MYAICICHHSSPWSWPTDDTKPCTALHTGLYIPAVPATALEISTQFCRPPPSIAAENHTTVERLKVDVADEDRVNHGRVTSRGGHVSHGRRCCAPQTTEDDGQQSQQRRLSEHPNDAWASWELSCFATDSWYTLDCATLRRSPADRQKSTIVAE